ncbi:MAG: glycosyltransferase family 2 protein [Eggerthellaceae bacterium]|nr:glycosyltransferase family 2 protein [Eggerthellaceae bacterium]
MDFSLIIPCYNEEANLPVLFPTLISCFGPTGLSCELVFVNDGSSDGTSAVLRKEVESYARRPDASGRIAIRVIEFSRNFGKEAAMFAGLEHATGDILGFIDADMQQDPEVALKMLRMLQDDPELDCVAAVQDRRRESLPLRICKRLFYRMFRDMSNLDVVEGASDFRVFRRSVANALLSMRESFRFSKGMFSWVGFNTRAITYQVHERYAGKSKWSLCRLLGYAWNGIVAFSTWPLRAVMILGVVLAAASIALFLFDALDNAFFRDGLSVGRIMIYLVLLVTGVQMAVLGVFGEYLARAYIESKHRPLYISRREYAVPICSEPMGAVRGRSERGDLSGFPCMLDDMGCSTDGAEDATASRLEDKGVLQ